MDHAVFGLYTQAYVKPSAKNGNRSSLPPTGADDADGNPVNSFIKFAAFQHLSTEASLDELATFKD